MNMMFQRVEELIPGTKVDLSACPLMNTHPSARYELGVVSAIEKKSERCIAVTYEGLERVGYRIGTFLRVMAGNAAQA